MKLSLDSIGYGGYFTAPGEWAPLEDVMHRAAKFGYDGVCIYAHRPVGFPMDITADRRKRLKDLAVELDLEFGAVVCSTNFVEGDHVLVYPREKEILYAHTAIDLARDLGIPVIRLMAALFGYFQNRWAGQGYGGPAFEARSRRVSRNEDWIEAWHQVREALHEVALYAQDQGVTIALQTHPEITGNNKETLEMLEEVNVPSLKAGLDLPLLESQDPTFIRNTVEMMKDYIVYSHTISIAGEATVGGAAYKWEEVTPGSPNDPCNWDVFIKAMRDVGYTGFLSHEQCSPIIIKEHKLGGLDVIDQRYIEAHQYLKNLLKKYDCYTGHKVDLSAALPAD